MSHCARLAFRLPVTGSSKPPPPMKARTSKASSPPGGWAPTTPSLISPSAYVAAQGAALRRAGRVHVQREGDTVWIGGDVTSVVEGEVAI